MVHFFTLGQGGFPFIARNAERAGHHAIPAAHAFVGIVNHRPRRGLVQRAHGTNRRAGGFLAVHAESPHENAAMRLDHIQRVGGQFAVHFAVALGEGDEVILAQRLCWQILGSAGLIEGKIVHDLTGCSAGSTADAFRCVDENGFAHFLNISDGNGHIVYYKVRPVKSISTPCAEKFIS